MVVVTISFYSIAFFFISIGFCIIPIVGNYLLKEDSHLYVFLGSFLIMLGLMIIYWTMMVGNVGVVVTSISLMGVVAIAIDYIFYGYLASELKLVGCGVIIIGIMVTFLMDPILDKCKKPKSNEEPLIQK
jgi:drug/metabolite transporter (DMT)-like permease